MNQTRPLHVVLVEDGGSSTIPAHIVRNLNELHYVLHVVRNTGEMLSLSMENEIDVILLNFVGKTANDFPLLERVCEAFSRIPVIACLCNDAESERQRALRTGVHTVLTNAETHDQGFAHIIRSATLRKHDRLWQHDRSLEQALTFLQQNPASARRVMKLETFGLKPLSEAMPFKFLELSKSYSNVIELVTSRREPSGARLSCQSVSRKLHFLASDLGALKADVNDVFDLHSKALEHKSHEQYAYEEQHREILVELLADLVSFYRKDEQPSA